jgi:signal transduction histidine kinase
MAKKIVEYHGGTIWVDTAHRDGTAIRFTLPGQPVPAELSPEPEPERALA